MNILYAAPPEGFRGWCSAEGISSKVTDPAKLQACYDYINWNYNGFLGAAIMRQGYYIAQRRRSCCPWIKSARRADRPASPPAEYDYWWGGKAAPRDLPGITGKVGDIKKGERREGGSFPQRICKYISWNSYSQGERVPGQAGERLPHRLASAWLIRRVSQVRGGGIRRPLAIERVGARPRRADQGVPRRHGRGRRRQPARRSRRVRRPARAVRLRQDDDAADDRRPRVPDARATSCSTASRSSACRRTSGRRRRSSSTSRSSPTGRCSRTSSSG